MEHIDLKGGLALAIARLRNKLQLSQGQLSRNLSVTRATISQWESAGTSPRLHEIPRVAYALGTTTVKLVGLAVKLGSS